MNTYNKVFYNLFHSNIHFSDLDETANFFYNSLENDLNPSDKYGFLCIGHQNNNYSQDDYILTVNSVFNRLVHIINSLFSTSLNPQLYIVDKLPSPFSNRTWKAMSINESQSLKFSLDMGIYFVKKYIIPDYFEIIICHELIHQAISCKSAFFNTYASSLTEEGICDYMSYYVILKNNIIDTQNVSRYISCNRCLSKKWSNYWKASCRVSNYFYDKLHFQEKINDLLSSLKLDNNIIEEIEFISRKCNSYLSISLEEYLLFINVPNQIEMYELKNKMGWTENKLFTVLNSLLYKNLLYYDDKNVYNYNLSFKDNVYFYI